MAKIDLNKREYNGKICSKGCPYNKDGVCELYDEDICDEDRDYIQYRCKKCLKDIAINDTTSSNKKLIELLEINNELLMEIKHELWKISKK